MSTPGDQPAIVPPSPTKMNTLAPLLPACVTAKSVEPLKTMPVGSALPAVPGGIDTTSDCRAPLPSYKVDFELPSSATQTKPCGLKAMPQPLIRFGSLFAVLYGPLAPASAIRLVSA